MADFPAVGAPFPGAGSQGLGQGAQPAEQGKAEARASPRPRLARTSSAAERASLICNRRGIKSPRAPLPGVPRSSPPPSGRLTSQSAARAGGWLRRRWSPPLPAAAPPGRPLGLQAQRLRGAPRAGALGRGPGSGVGAGPGASRPFWPGNPCKVFKKKNSPEEDVTFS